MAAGSGSRMGGDVPKQFLLLKGKPVLQYSIEAFYQNDPETNLILVLAKEEITRWKSLREKHKLAVPHTIAIGGITRTESVKHGLSLVTSDGLVAIHDGARPLISQNIIEKCFESAEKFGSGVACIKPKDSIRQVVEKENFALDREHLRLVQTPQTFLTSLVKSAFATHGNEPSFDDATIVEMAGHPINLVEGSYHNLKITTPEDLAFAEALLA